MGRPVPNRTDRRQRYDIAHAHSMTASNLQKSNMMSRFSATFFAVYALWIIQSACHARFTDTGVPCYLRPSGDRCHYRAKPDSPTCTSADDRRRLAEGARQLNRSIVVLEQKLIRLGVSKY